MKQLPSGSEPADTFLIHAPAHAVTLRDAVAPLFRHKWTGLLVAVTVLAATAAAIVLLPRRYESSMTLLVKRERAESVVSADAGATAQRPAEVSEGELNSEAELIQSQDLLQQVAIASGMAPADAGDSIAGRLKVAQAVRTLSGSLTVAPVRKTSLIKVSYSSDDPEQAARVLTELGQRYLQKHLQVHKANGAYDFFRDQTDRFADQMKAAESELSDFGRRESVVMPEIEKESALRQAAEFASAREQARAQIADADKRIAQLEAAQAGIPQRRTTQVRVSENTQLVATLKAKVAELELKRTDLLQKFAPTYPLVIDLEAQLEQARRSLSEAEQIRSTDETTDQNPTYQWIDNELAKVRSDRSAAVARAESIEQSAQLYEGKARTLDEKSTVERGLTRTLKTAEENYLLYAKKQEEARISDALDQTRIGNVSIAEAPTVPALPSSTGRRFVLLVGIIMAISASLMATYALDYLSPLFHTPRDLEDTLEIQVLATLPAR